MSIVDFKALNGAAFAGASIPSVFFKIRQMVYNRRKKTTNMVFIVISFSTHRFVSRCLTFVLITIFLDEYKI